MHSATGGSGQPVVLMEEVTRAAEAAAWALCKQTAQSQETRRQQGPKAARPVSFPVPIPLSPPTLPFVSSKCCREQLPQGPLEFSMKMRQSLGLGA